VAHRGDRRRQRSLADDRPPDLARALDGGLAQAELSVGDWSGATVDDQRRADGRGAQ